MQTRQLLYLDALREPPYYPISIWARRKEEKLIVQIRQRKVCFSTHQNADSAMGNNTLCNCGGNVLLFKEAQFLFSSHKSCHHSGLNGSRLGTEKKMSGKLLHLLHLHSVFHLGDNQPLQVISQCSILSKTPMSSLKNN